MAKAPSLTNFAEMTDEEILGKAFSSGERLVDDLWYGDIASNDAACVTLAQVDIDLKALAWLGTKVLGTKGEWNESDFDISDEENFYAYAGGKAITAATHLMNSSAARYMGMPIPDGGLDWDGGSYRSITYVVGEEVRRIAVAVGCSGVQGRIDEVVANHVADLYCALWVMRDIARQTQAA